MCATAGIICFNFRRAFPAIARDYIWWVLEFANVPTFIVGAIRALHRSCKQFNVLEGRVFMAIDIHCGVKQGRPLSMLLFCFAIDPLIRMMCSRLGPEDVLCAYCDDIAATVSNLVEALRRLKKPFRIAAAAANLWLSPTKIQCLTLDDCVREALFPLLDGELAYVKGLKFQNAVKLLGVYLGPAAASIQWKESIKKYEMACAQVRSLDAGLAASIAIYNFVAHSRIAWLASICAPSDDVLHAEEHALKTLTRGPYNKFTLALLSNLQSIGLPAGAKLVSLTSIAGRARTATTSSVFGDCMTKLRYTRDVYVDCVLVPPLMNWVNNSILIGLDSAVNHPICKSILAEHRLKPKHHLQAEIYKSLFVALPPFSLQDLLISRYCSWVDADSHGAVRALAKDAVDLFQGAVTCIPPAFSVVILKTILDAWPTSNNFGQSMMDCPFCHMKNGENCFHFCVCTSLLDAYDAVPGVRPLPEMCWPFIPKACSREAKRSVIAHMVACFHCFNWCRGGREFNSNVYRSFMFKIMRESSSTRVDLMHVG